LSSDVGCCVLTWRMTHSGRGRVTISVREAVFAEMKGSVVL
jgi:hypothetical protein